MLSQALTVPGHFFEMSKSDAQRAMDIYRTFTKQTDLVVGFLSTARTFEHQTRVEVPKLKHAPVHLGKQLSDYLADPDFEINRRQYLAEQEAKRFKKGGSAKPFPSPSVKITENKSGATYFPSVPNSTATSSTRPDFSAANTKSAEPTKAKGPAPDLIDFFDSIEQNQQPMASEPQQYQQQINAPAPNFQQIGFQQPQPQQFQNGFAQPQPQQTGFQGPNQQQQQQQQPFGGGFMPQQPTQQQQPAPQLTPNFTGAGFGGYTPAPQQQTFQSNLSPIPQQQQATGFGQPQQQFQTGAGASGLAPQVTNPFRASMMMNMQGQNMMQSPSPVQQLQPQNTNPFARAGSAPVAASTPPVPNLPNQYTPGPFQPQHAQTFPLPQGSTPSPAPLQGQSTGTNPFAKGGAAGMSRPGTAGGGLMPQQTGSTNPFRQSQFVNTATGQPWQQQQQMPIGGGLDQLETVPVFPRPGQQQAWQQ